MMVHIQSCSELRLDGGVGSSISGENSLSDWPGRLRRLNKCSRVNCVKIQLKWIQSALCPVLKVLNLASELGTTEKHENYSRPISNDRSSHIQ